jgi:hypothetical protein
MFVAAAIVNRRLPATMAAGPGGGCHWQSRTLEGVDLPGIGACWSAGGGKRSPAAGSRRRVNLPNGSTVPVSRKGPAGLSLIHLLAPVPVAPSGRAMGRKVAALGPDPAHDSRPAARGWVLGRVPASGLGAGWLVAAVFVSREMPDASKSAEAFRARRGSTLRAGTRARCSWGSWRPLSWGGRRPRCRAVS